MLFFLLLCACFGAVPSSDPPVAGSQRVLLSDWTLSNGNLVASSCSVPGDLVTDLYRSGLIPEPHTDLNWLKFSSVVWSQNWTYSTQFDAPFSEGSTLLVLDGVKMGAHVRLNGVALSDVPNQFLRYSFDVSALLRSTGNLLTLTFPESVDNSTGIKTEGRFMAW
jgi:beta-galactosidase/beta-glucuronidase